MYPYHILRLARLYYPKVFSLIAPLTVLSWRSVLCESINQSTEGESHAHKESIISAPLRNGFARTVLNFNTVQRSHKNQSIH